MCLPLSLFGPVEAAPEGEVLVRGLYSTLFCYIISYSVLFRPCPWPPPSVRGTFAPRR